MTLTMPLFCGTETRCSAVLCAKCKSDLTAVHFFRKKGVPLGRHQYSSRCVCVCGFLFPNSKKEQVFFICVPSISLPTPLSRSLQGPLCAYRSSIVENEKGRKIDFWKKLPLLRQFSPPYCIHYTHTLRDHRPTHTVCETRSV